LADKQKQNHAALVTFLSDKFSQSGFYVEVSAPDPESTAGVWTVRLEDKKRKRLGQWMGGMTELLELLWKLAGLERDNGGMMAFVSSDDDDEE
jgi:hypothetical protein